MDSENLYDKLNDYLGKAPDNFNILEEQIEIELQMEYFEFSNKLKGNVDEEKTLTDIDRLFAIDTMIGDKKTLLAELASIDKVEAYRAIEKYVKDPDKDLKDWAILALQESRMLLESSFLDENQVFISTGLGGKGNKLRYFIVLLSKKEINFTETQKKLIKSEFDFFLRKQNAEIEKTTFNRNLSTILALIPINVSIKDVFREAINECNQYGNFLKENFIITNVKSLSIGEIKEILEKNDPEINSESLK